MLKKILNFSGRELLTKEQQKNILGGGEAPLCYVYAPPGSSPATYPYYPCAHVPGQIPTLCPDPNDDFAPPIIC